MWFLAVVEPEAEPTGLVERFQPQVQVRLQELMLPPGSLQVPAWMTVTLAPPVLSPEPLREPIRLSVQVLLPGALPVQVPAQPRKPVQRLSPRRRPLPRQLSLLPALCRTR